MKWVYIWGIFGYIINILLYFLLYKPERKIIQKNELELSELRILSKSQFTAQIKAQYDEIKILSHDLENCLQTTKLLLAEDKIEDAKRYINELVKDKLEKVLPMVCTKSNIVNAVFNSKIAVCSQLEIALIYELIDIYPTNMELDICIILSNLLDNAIEASKKISANREIIVCIKSYESLISIMVKNRIESSILNSNPNLHTTKPDKIKHGYGMKSIRKILDKYFGTKKVYENDTYFIVEIILEI